MKKLTWIGLILLLTYSCTDQNKAMDEREQILKNFDSINNELKKTEFKLDDRVPVNTQPFYDSLEIKLAGTPDASGMKQFYYEVNDFYGFLSDLKRRFIIACGDSSGTALPAKAEENRYFTNEFFLSNNSNAAILLPKINELVEKAQQMAKSEISRAMVKKLSSVTVEKFKSEPGFRKTYFKDIPPVAAITILNSFESQVRNIEARILADYLNP